MSHEILQTFHINTALLHIRTEGMPQNMRRRLWKGISVNSTDLLLDTSYVVLQVHSNLCHTGLIKKDKIVNTHKYMLFSTKHDEIPKTAIEAIDITENPASGRYFVSVISDEKSITFGAKLPIKDLRWVKKFLIHEVIK